MEFIQNFETSKNVNIFLNEHISMLEKRNLRKEKIDYLSMLSLKERILLITLMYIGRDENHEKNLILDFKYSYSQWKDDEMLIEQMVDKIYFVDYLKKALNIYSE
ncbi:MAG: hypothetical protein ACRCXT_05565 [Paraclostridium sp.]